MTMIKILGLVILALVLFSGTLVGMVALTGNLNKAGLDRVMGKDELPVETPAVEEDEVAVLARGLKERETALNKRKAILDEREQRIEQRRLELVTLLEDATEIQNTIDESLEATDADHEERLMDVASSLATMKAANAAAILDGWPSSAEVATILRKVEEKKRGKMLDAMDLKRATEVLRIIQERKF